MLALGLGLGQSNLIGLGLGQSNLIEQYNGVYEKYHNFSNT